VFLIMVFGATAIIGCSSAGGGGRAAPPARATTTITTNTAVGVGARIFRDHCAACHGANGHGELGPPLVGIAQRVTLAEEQMIVRSGNGRMPSFGAALTDADINAVIAYTREQLR
jgi:mono/diheme cytochrome c family protein